ncbi:MAG: ABC transporter ATP-binding protein [Candidatus Bathyarchaeota archaeon]|nr:ABC transporter ATP-binding protein [Candidatus Bathyarchaeota archaeon]
MPEVRVVNLTKKFDNITAVDNVTLTIHDQEYFSLLGPSGCGKTTLLRLIAGLIEPTSGEIYIGNKLVNDMPPEDRDVGFVFQTFALFPHMTAWNNVIYGPKVKGFDMAEATTVGHEVLEMVKLHERLDAYPSELSGGMMQRVAVARALAAGAQLLLMDEALGQLDAKVRNEIRYEIRKMAKDLKLTGIHVTHDQSEAMAISDRIAVMRKGKILQIGTPQELYMKPESIFVAHFIGESNFLEGYVVGKTEDGNVLIELREDTKVEALNGSFSEDTQVVLSMRPETLIVEPGLEEGNNVLSGTVERITFEGANIRYEIRLDNEEMIVAVKPTLSGDWLKVGERTKVFLPVDYTHVFPYPEAGLKEELSVA